jgi:hypothetical protein
VRAWADALRAGHVHQASSFFALPAVVANGGDPVILRTRAELDFFNSSLPCGARVVRALAGRGRYTIVTFRLTERKLAPAPCGSGVGHLAATAFAFRGGKISECQRVTVPPADAPGHAA